MKKYITLFFILGAMAFVNTAYAQKEDFSNLPDEQLTKEQAEMRIKEFENKVNALNETLKGLDADIAKLKQDIEKAKQDKLACRQAILDMLGATEDDIKNFRQSLGVIINKIREMSGKSNEQLNAGKADIDQLEADLNKLKGIKIACMSEFYDKIVNAAGDIRELRRRAESAIVNKKYIVKTWAVYHDCLWNISKKPEIYGDPLLWPRIWQANTDIIRNPGLIHPGDELTIPVSGPKSDEELKAERKYWRNKNRMKKEAGSTEKGTN